VHREKRARCHWTAVSVQFGSLEYQIDTNLNSFLAGGHMDRVIDVAIASCNRSYSTKQSSSSAGAPASDFSRAA
jgi:hypothetical protein